MKHILIPIAGFARSGKDSLADAIFRHLEYTQPTYSVITLKFADALKADLEKAMAAVGVRVDAFTEVTAEKAALRPLLVGYGEYRRSRDQDVWVNKLLAEVNTWVNGTLVASDSDVSLILVPDMRYLNEYEKLKACADRMGWAFVPIYIERHGNLPANDQEAESIGLMAAKGCFSSGNAMQLSFADNRLDQLSQWAHRFTQEINVYL
jgi:hypothetical protein